ncbi:hypothetical protein ACFXPX_36810 [Kitasatospora sp. NPDC059146]|uniref:hypothetical protein n=1 Tax=unclassified Kitasatospora TaxID=2633591 RepID=UPI0036BEF1C8
MNTAASFPASSVPVAFDAGHLHSPTADDVAAGIDFRPGDRFEPMAPTPSGGVREKAAWWRTVANVGTPDFLGLVTGSTIAVELSGSPTPGVVISTFRAGARVQTALPDGTRIELTVSRRHPSGYWYGRYS